MIYYPAREIRFFCSYPIYTEPEYVSFVLRYFFREGLYKLLKQNLSNSVKYGEGSVGQNAEHVFQVRILRVIKNQFFEVYGVKIFTDPLWGKGRTMC